MLEIELLTFAGATVVAIALLPRLYVVKKREAASKQREAAIDHLIQQAKTERAHYAPIDFRKGPLKSGCARELAEMEMRFLRSLIDHFSGRAMSGFFPRNDPFLGWYLSGLSETEMPSLEHIWSHFCYRVIHWDDDQVIKEHLETVISRGALASMLIDEHKEIAFRSIELNVGRLLASSDFLKSHKLEIEEYHFLENESKYTEDTVLEGLLQLIKNPTRTGYHNTLNLFGGPLDKVYLHFIWRVIHWPPSSHAVFNSIDLVKKRMQASWTSSSTNIEQRRKLEDITSREALARILVDELQKAMRYATLGNKKSDTAESERAELGEKMKVMFTAVWDSRIAVFHGVPEESFEERLTPEKCLRTLLDRHRNERHVYKRLDLDAKLGIPSDDCAPSAECRLLRYLLRNYRHYDGDPEVEAKMGPAEAQEHGMLPIWNHYLWRVVFWKDETHTNIQARHHLEEITTREGLASFLLKTTCEGKAVALKKSPASRDEASVSDCAIYNGAAIPDVRKGDTISMQSPPEGSGSEEPTYESLCMDPFFSGGSSGKRESGRTESSTNPSSRHQSAAEVDARHVLDGKRHPVNEGFGPYVFPKKAGSHDALDVANPPSVDSPGSDDGAEGGADVSDDGSFTRSVPTVDLEDLEDRK